jgi:hypothetical protein
MQHFNKFNPHSSVSFCLNYLKFFKWNNCMLLTFYVFISLVEIMGFFSCHSIYQKSLFLCGSLEIVCIFQIVFHQQGPLPQPLRLLLFQSSHKIYHHRLPHSPEFWLLYLVYFYVLVDAIYSLFFNNFVFKFTIFFYSLQYTYTHVLIYLHSQILMFNLSLYPLSSPSS